MITFDVKIFETEPFFISSANFHLAGGKSFVGLAGVLQCEKNKPWTTYLPHYKMRTLILLSQVVKFIFLFHSVLVRFLSRKNPNTKICVAANLVKKVGSLSNCDLFSISYSSNKRMRTEKVAYL